MLFTRVLFARRCIRPLTPAAPLLADPRLRRRVQLRGQPRQLLRPEWVGNTDFHSDQHQPGHPKGPPACLSNHHHIHRQYLVLLCTCMCIIAIASGQPLVVDTSCTSHRSETIRVCRVPDPCRPCHRLQIKLRRPFSVPTHQSVRRILSITFAWRSRVVLTRLRSPGSGRRWTLPDPPHVSVHPCAVSQVQTLSHMRPSPGGQCRPCHSQG